MHVFLECVHVWSGAFWWACVLLGKLLAFFLARQLPSTLSLTTELNSSWGNYLHCWLLASYLCSRWWILPLSCSCPDGLDCFSSLGFLLSLSLQDLQAPLSQSHYNVPLSLVSVHVLQRASNIMLWPRCRESIASSSAIFFWAPVTLNGTEVSLWCFTAKEKTYVFSGSELSNPKHNTKLNTLFN